MSGKCFLDVSKKHFFSCHEFFFPVTSFFPLTARKKSCAKKNMEVKFLRLEKIVFRYIKKN